MTTIPESELPAPRLELRWVALDEPEFDGHFTWTVKCVYALVLSLCEHDIRRECQGVDGNDLPGVSTTRVEFGAVFGATRSTGTVAKRYNTERDEVDTPFRDHSHALWDSKHIGEPPIYAVAMGRAMLVEDKSK